MQSTIEGSVLVLRSAPPIVYGRDVSTRATSSERLRKAANDAAIQPAEDGSATDGVEDTNDAIKVTDPLTESEPNSK